MWYDKIYHTSSIDLVFFSIFFYHVCRKHSVADAMHIFVNLHNIERLGYSQRYKIFLLNFLKKSCQIIWIMLNY